MNKRIEEFIKEATVWEGMENGYIFDKEKFAKLIVKETLQVARAGVEFGNGMEDAVYNYFGVEE